MWTENLHWSRVLEIWAMNPSSMIILELLQVIATKTKIYLVMEYVSGGPLTEKLVGIVPLG